MPWIGDQPDWDDTPPEDGTLYLALTKPADQLTRPTHYRPYLRTADIPQLPYYHDKRLWHAKTTEREGWVNAHQATDPLAWVWECGGPGCERYSTPIWGVRNLGINLWTENPAGPDSFTDPEWGWVCMRCRAQYPGPQPVVRYRRSTPGDGGGMVDGEIVLQMIWARPDGKHLYATNYIYEESALFRGAVIQTWVQLQRAGEEKLVYVHSCSIPGCETIGRIYLETHLRTTPAEAMSDQLARYDASAALYDGAPPPPRGLYLEGEVAGKIRRARVWPGWKGWVCYQHYSDLRKVGAA